MKHLSKHITLFATDTDHVSNPKLFSKLVLAKHLLRLTDVKASKSQVQD